MATASGAAGRPEAGADDGELLTIDQLAARVGMTSRNIRAYQARGLVPAPTLRGRTGYYSAEHVTRLHLVRQLQDEGLNLTAIAKVLADGSLARAILAPFDHDAAEVVDLAELAARLRVDAATGPRVALRAADLGILELLDDGRVRVRTPVVLRRAEELVELGVPIDAMLDAIAPVVSALDEVGEAFVRLAEGHLIVPIADRSQGDPEVVGAVVERLRGVAAEVVTALVDRAIAERLSQLLG